MGKQARLQADGARETPAAEEVLWSEGTQSAAKYIGLRKVTAAQWVAIRPILEVCAWDTVY